MSLMDRVQKDLVDAMKAKDETKLTTVRAIKAALLKYKADQMKDADEQAEMQILNQLLKQRAESADVFRKNGREELATKEEAEFKLIEAYMPASATPEDIAAAIAEAIAEAGGATMKNMGAIMKGAQARLKGKRVDGKALSDQVRAQLS
ncbi:MAG: GatB/YqeY domain-containing protein [Bryobacteraceae bacterium]|nr:GatB/YqeY domain-containing protein [Bryobacteraceae bacterium]